jgi:RimJ/RimL family protein N-acetyltransferase
LKIKTFVEKMDVETLTAFPTAANPPSQKLLERKGFKVETDHSGMKDLGDCVFCERSRG